MRVIYWSVELLPGTPRRWSLAQLHSFDHRTHTFQLPSQLFYSTARHRRPHSTSNRNRIWHASTCLTAANENTKAIGYRKGSRRYVHQFTSPGHVSTSTDSYKTRLDALLAALRQCDTFKLYLCLLDFTRSANLNDKSFCRAVQTIPATTFSEILRSFDPFHISTHVDSAPGIPISWGAAIYTPLGDLINKWGVKVLYVRIFNRLRLLQRARQPPGLDGSHPQTRPLLRDYLVLLRCAGAISDIRAAKNIWWEIERDGYGDWRHAELYAEFIKVRYLTEALYANNDLSRLRLRPLDLHRSTVRLQGDVVTKLKRITASLTDERSHRFGQNVNEYYFAEPLTRQLRKRKPLVRLERRVLIRRMIPGDEMLLCAVLKANGRQGRVFASNVLMRLWGINISRFQPELGTWNISGGFDFPSGSALAPTEALLDAVVHCYGNMGEVPLAKALIDFISRRWDIPVPDKVWSSLLDYARIHSTDPAAREWRIAQIQSKIFTPDMVLDIWGFSTQAPHNFQPTMRDYHNLIRSMLGPQQPLDKCLDAIRQLTPLYKRTVRELQEAWTELTLTTQQGVSNHAAYRRYRVLQSSKHYIWYCFHYTAKQVLEKLNPMRVDSADDVTRRIPDLVAELEPFLRLNISYRIATGIVHLQLDAKKVQVMEGEQTWHDPHPLAMKPGYKDVEAETALENEPVKVDWTSLENQTNGIASSEALRLYMNTMDHLDRDEHMIEGEDEGEQETGHGDLQVDHEGQTQPKMNQRTDKQATDNLDEKGDLESMDEHVVLETIGPEQHVQDAFDESRNPVSKPPAIEKLNQTPKVEIEDAFRSRFQDSAYSSSAAQYSKDWDQDTTPDASAFTKRHVKAQQVVQRPAYMWRPRYSAPPGEPSLSALREDGENFTGLHDNPLKAHMAAHRFIRDIVHTPGVPVSLEAPGVILTKTQLMKRLFDVRA